MKKLFVLVRNDLPLAYQGVQAGHAVAEYLLNEREWDNGTLVYLQVDNIQRWLGRLQFLGIPHYPFKEPDIGNQVTAISIHSDGKLFRNLKLMGS